MVAVMQGSLDRSNPFTAEPDGPRYEGGAGCTEMGSGQLARQYCRIMGWVTCGMALRISSDLGCYSRSVDCAQGGEKYQQAFYVYEEMAQAPSTSATKSLVGQAVAEIHLGRLPEAEAALQQAMQKDPRDAEAIANTIVLSVLSGKDITDHLS